MEEQNTHKVQGISLEKLGKEFGTPLYVYDGEKIVKQLLHLKQAFHGVDLKVKYAAKALTNISILKLLRKHGAGTDVVSMEEARIAMKAGFQGDEIMFTPSGVAFGEIEEAVGLGILVNLDNLPALEKFGKKFGDRHPLAIRLNPNIMAGGNLKISTGHEYSKFGISIEWMDEIKAVVKRYGIKVKGLHIHTGSEIVDTEVFVKMVEILTGAAGDFPHLQFIDLGSGFKVAYQDGDPVTDLDEVGKRVVECVQQYQTRSGRKLEVWIEPGKYLVSEAGYLLVQVNVVKPTPALTFVGVNSGLNHLIRPMMYGAYHHIVNVSNPGGPLKTYSVVGYICETDTLGSDRELAEVKEGDMLAILNAGAYSFSMSSNYNSRVKPPEVLVWQGKAHLIRKRQDWEDLIRDQIEIDF